jgi:hypothetical protein
MGDQNSQQKLDSEGEIEREVEPVGEGMLYSGAASFLGTLSSLMTTAGEDNPFRCHGLPTEYTQFYGESGRHILVFMTDLVKAICRSLKWDQRESC